MKSIAFLFFIILHAAVLCGQNILFDNNKDAWPEKIINSQWTFNYFPGSNSDQGYESPGFNDSKWPAVSIPHTWFTYETTGLLYPFLSNVDDSDNLYWFVGWGWYRKHFTLSNDYYGKKVFIEFEAVQQHCKVYINGKLIGEKTADGPGFCFDISSHVRAGKDNLLAVAVSNRKDNSSLRNLIEKGGHELYGGIIGDVKLVLRNTLYFPPGCLSSQEGGLIISTQNITKKQGVAIVEAWVKNDNPQKMSCSLQSTITDRAGKIVQFVKTDAELNPGQLYKFNQAFKPVKKPHLWTHEDPYTYSLTSELTDGKNVVDRLTSPSGLRFALSPVPVAEQSEASVWDGLEGSLFMYMKDTPAIVRKERGSGDAAKIILKASTEKIDADRASVVKITADITDSQGNPVDGLRKTIKWELTGPAVLTGPDIYVVSNNHDCAVESWSGGLPVTNVVRSSGKPGIIKISAMSTGLASGSLEIIAEEIRSDNSVIAEPELEEEGRKPVARLIFTINRLVEAPREISFINDDFKAGTSDRKGYTSLVTDFILRNNTLVDSVSPEFLTLLNMFVSQLINNNGHISAKDYNYTVGHYNTYRLISGYIKSTKLPSLFKETLQQYYINSIIEEGSERNTGEEMNWLNWIPSGGTVVVSTDSKSNKHSKETLITESTDLNDLIALVYPVYSRFSPEGKKRALTFISKMNPYVHQTVEKESNDNSVEKISYTAEKGKPVLIPLLKFISE